MCKWVLDYLHARTQRVKVDSTLSSRVTTFIGAPQGCVLSLLLFTSYTNEHRGQDPHTLIVKYADDSAIAGLISDNDKSHYRSTADFFDADCDQDELELNVNKTKEIIIDFRKDHPPHIGLPLEIKETEISIVPEYDYLGTRVTDTLS